MEVTLKEICKMQSGGTPKSTNDLFYDGNIPWVTISDFKNAEGDIIYKTEQTLSKEGLEAINGRLFKKNTLLLAMYGSVGKTAILGVDASTNQAILGINPKDEKTLNIKFLKYWLDFNKQFLYSQGKGATLHNISLSVVQRQKINLPDLETQNKIVAILDKAKAILDKREESIQKYDELLRATFLEMFGDPVKNEKGWEVERLGEICDVGSSKRVFVEELTDTGIPFYRGTEIGRMAEFIDISPSLFITENHYEQLKAHTGVPEIGDLLLPSICPDGRIYRVVNDSPFYFKDGRVLWIKVNSVNINSIYLQFALKAIFSTNYQNIASGTTFAELKIIALKKIRIPIPPLTIQAKFASIIEKIESLLIKFRISKSETQNLYKGLSQLAFKGELNFNTAVDLEVLLENDYQFFKDNSNTKSIKLLLDRIDENELNENKFYEQDVYNKAKSFLFELLKEGKVNQVFDEKTKRVKLTV